MATSGRFALERVSRGSVAERVASQLIERIVDDEMVSGSPLPTENELAAAFGVGKSAVREAVKIVATKGLVQVIHGSGMRVAPRERWNVIDPELVALIGRSSVTMDHLIEVRRSLEPDIAAAAATRATEAELLEFDEIVGRTAAALAIESDFVVVDLEFHDFLATATHNPIYPILTNSVSDLLVESRRGLARSRASRERGIHHHRRILEALRERDPAAARRRMEDHLDQVTEDWELAASVTRSRGRA